MNVSGFCRLRACGSFRAAATSAWRWRGPPSATAGGAVRLVGSSVPLRANEGETRLTELLREKLSPTHLVVEDMSGGCGSAYSIQIDSVLFRGKRLVQQHKLVNEAIGDEMKSIHAVSIRIGGPKDTLS